MIDPGMTDDRAAYVRAMILARCPELGPADLALIGTLHPGPPTAEPDLPMEIGRDIMAVLAAMDERLDDLVEAIGDGDADDLAG
jgi:hypothetical protein